MESPLGNFPFVSRQMVKGGENRCLPQGLWPPPKGRQRTPNLSASPLYSAIADSQAEYFADCEMWRARFDFRRSGSGGS